MMVDELLLARLIIRHAALEDLPALEWNGEFKHFRNLYADTFRNMGRGEAVMWLAELPVHEIIGQAFVSLVSNRPELADGDLRAYVYGFRVRPRFQRLGVGTRLMVAIEGDLRKRCYEYVTLNVARDNHGARRLYERLGYQIIAEEPGEWNYVDETGVRHFIHEPAWRMEKKIIGIDGK